MVKANTKPKEKQRCSACREFSPEGTRLWKVGDQWLCKPCRKAAEKAGEQPIVCRPPTAAEAERLAAEEPEYVRPIAPAVPAPPAEVERQTVFPTELERRVGELQEQNRELRQALEKKRTQLDQLLWLVSGYLRGFATREQVEDALGV